MKKIIFVHFKILRGNFFLLISDYLGKLLFNKSCGCLGFKNIQKRSKESFLNLISLGIQFLLNLESTNQLLIKMEGITSSFLYLIQNKFINVLESNNIKIFSIKLINKISHNGCRKTYFLR